MKNKKILCIILTASLIFGACTDWLDVNKDPNRLNDIESAEVVIPVTQVNIANAIMGWDMGFAGAFWMQYWTQDHLASQFKFLDEYDETDFDYAYGNFLPYALNDLKRIISLSETNSGEYLIAEALSIYTWQMVTDTWGDVPYSSALKGDEGIFSVPFDTQEDIYQNLMERINALLNTNFSNASMLPGYDFIFKANMDDWISFARSLKLKLMIRLSETPLYDNTATLEFVKKGGFLSKNASIPADIWEDKEGKRHPMIEFEAGGANYLATNVIASTTFLSFISDSLQDNRVNKLFVAPDGGHKGSFQGDFAYEGDTDGNGTKDEKEGHSTVKFDANSSDIPLLSIWEVNFYIAEVYLRDGDHANAKKYYDEGVQASFDYWGVDNNITGAGGTAEWKNGTLEKGLEQIAHMKWVAYCKTQHFEAFIERNRLKYPAVHLVDVDKHRSSLSTKFPKGYLTLSVAGRALLSEKVPSSPIYPNDLITRNPTNPEQKTNLGQKVWWDQKKDIYTNKSY